MFSPGTVTQIASKIQLWYFLCCTSEQGFKQTAKLSVIWNAMTLMSHRCNVNILNPKHEKCASLLWLSKTPCAPNSIHLVKANLIAWRHLLSKVSGLAERVPWGLDSSQENIWRKNTGSYSSIYHEVTLLHGNYKTVTIYCYQMYTLNSNTSSNEFYFIKR